ERAPAPLDEEELGRDLIGPVDREARTGLRERRERYAELVRQGGGPGRGRYAPDIPEFSRCHKLPDPAHRERGRRARPESHYHAALDVTFYRRVGGLALRLVRAAEHQPPTLPQAWY